MECAQWMLAIPVYADWLNAMTNAATKLLLTMEFGCTVMSPSTPREGLLVIWPMKEPVRQIRAGGRNITDKLVNWPVQQRGVRL
jgi:hypothetical protein